jgi:hypothetical protein
VTEPFHKDRRDFFLILGATLTIIAGVLSLINGLEGLLARTHLFTFLPSAGESLVPVCGIILVLFGVVAIAGGVYALRPRPYLTPVLLGAALGMLGGGVYGFFLGLAAILLFWLANVDL